MIEVCRGNLQILIREFLSFESTNLGSICGMGKGLVHRNVLGVASELLRDAPIIEITGARQTGKNTLTRLLFDSSNDLGAERLDPSFYTLDEFDVYEAVLEDVDGFVRRAPQKTMIIGEVQRLPQMFTAIKAEVDRDRRPGRFVITGSSSLLDLQGAQESLAGRVINIHIEGFSQGELIGVREDFASLLWSLRTDPGVINQLGGYEEFSRGDYLNKLVQSDFPELVGKSRRYIDRWYGSYIEGIVSKDLRELVDIRHPDRLTTLLEIIAAANSAEMSYSKFGEMLDAPSRSIPTYLRALENVFLIRKLQAWSNNHLKRPVQKPKWFLRDTGMAAYLAGIDANGIQEDKASAIRGGLLEGFVVAELSKQQAWSEIDFRLYHFRDRNGPEVDIVMETRGQKVFGIEVEATTSVGARHFNGLKYLSATLGEKFQGGVVIYLGNKVLPFGENLWALPLAALWKH